MAVLFTSPYFQAFDDDGNPLSGGKVYTYAATTNTPKPTFTTAAGNIENQNPIILDAAGRAVIFISGSYKYVITDADDNIIRTVDNVTSFTALAAASEAYFQSFTGDGSTVTYNLSENLGTDSKAVMVFIGEVLEELTTNGDFATDTDWTKGAGWTIGTGVATATGGISTAITQTADQGFIDGQAYRVTYTITRSAGGLIPSIGGRSGTERTASGTYTEIIVAGSTDEIAFTGNAFTGTLDNVIINVVSTNGMNVLNPNQYTLTSATITFVSPPADSAPIFIFAPSLLVGSASASAEAAEAAEAGALAAQTAAETAQTNAETAETNAENAETGALAAQAAAEAAADKLTGTSTTSLAIGTGEKIFTTQADKFFEAGNWLLITSDADPENYMHGQVTTYSGTTLTMNITNIGGTGTLDDWTIRLSGTRGAVGATGPSGSISDGDKGDITVSSSGAVWMVNDDTITLAKMASGTAGNLITYDASGDPAAVATGTAGQVLTSNGAGAAPTFENASGGVSAARLTYTVAANTAGFTLTSGDFRTIPINTEDFDPDGIVTLSSNQFTLAAGTYTIHAVAEISGGVGNLTLKSKIRNVTDSADVLLGATTFGSPNQTTPAHSLVLGAFTIGASKALEFQVRPSVNTSAIAASNMGVSEVYAQIILTKVG